MFNLLLFPAAHRSFCSLVEAKSRFGWIPPSRQPWRGLACCLQAMQPGAVPPAARGPRPVLLAGLPCLRALHTHGCHGWLQQLPAWHPPRHGAGGSAPSSLPFISSSSSPEGRGPRPGCWGRCPALAPTNQFLGLWVDSSTPSHALAGSGLGARLQQHPGTWPHRPKRERCRAALGVCFKRNQELNTQNFLILARHQTGSSLHSPPQLFFSGRPYIQIAVCTYKCTHKTKR